MVNFPFRGEQLILLSGRLESAPYNERLGGRQLFLELGFFNSERQTGSADLRPGARQRNDRHLVITRLELTR